MTNGRWIKLQAGQVYTDRYPWQKYLIVISVGGTDMAAHESGFKSYSQAIEDLDGGPGLAGGRMPRRPGMSCWSQPTMA